MSGVSVARGFRELADAIRGMADALNISTNKSNDIKNATLPPILSAIEWQIFRFCSNTGTGCEDQPRCH